MSLPDMAAALRSVTGRQAKPHISVVRKGLALPLKPRCPQCTALTRDWQQALRERNAALRAAERAHAIAEHAQREADSLRTQLLVAQGKAMNDAPRWQDEAS